VPSEPETDALRTYLSRIPEPFSADRRPAELAAELEVTAVWYADEDPRGRAHDTLRLLTTDALAAIVAVETL
jgi:hypothetical protein